MLQGFAASQRSRRSKNRGGASIRAGTSRVDSARQTGIFERLPELFDEFHALAESAARSHEASRSRRGGDSVCDRSSGGGTASSDVGELARLGVVCAGEPPLGNDLQWPEFSAPMLGIVFLRAVSQQFDRLAASSAAVSPRNRIGPDDYRAHGVLFVPESSRFSAISEVPEGGNLADCAAGGDAPARSCES